MKALTDNEVTKFLTHNLKEWSFDKKVIKKEIRFKNFAEAFSFMTAVPLKLFKLNHHPDWSNVYNNVSIKLNSHEANGITQLDFDLAKTIDRISNNYSHTIKQNQKKRFIME